ncbi:MAG: transketolase family protein [Candidatus Brocadiia bacterium]|nr:MAG: transketolase family protein [Candidatus Brocadiia bacterium]
MSEKIAPRAVLGETLIKLAEENPDIVVLDADFNTASLIAPYKKRFPERFIQCGIAEQNMMSIAAGMSTTGFIPFASTIATFCSRRACDQVAVSIAISKLNVKILALYPGFLVGTNGASHQSMEDISIMRAMPNMTVVHPADAVETRSVLRYAAEYNGPMYIRVAREELSQCVPNDYKFELGKSLTLKEGSDSTVITYGELIEDVLEAASMAEKKGISVRVINMSSIKPIDEDAIVKAAKETGKIITVDNHNIIGGVGSAVCEVVAEKYPVRVKRLGVKDIPGRSGKNKDMKRYFGLLPEDIADAIVNFPKN